jgi:hypothetical protein
VLLVKVQKLWNRNVHFVVAPDQIGFAFFFLVLDAFCLLVVFNGFLDRIRDSLEDSQLIAPEHSFLHDFNAVYCLQIAWSNLHGGAQKWHDVLLHGVLLFVFNFDPDISAVLNIRIIWELRKGKEHVDVSVPKVDEEHQRVHCDRQHDGEHWHQLFTVEDLAPEVMPDYSTGDEQWGHVSSEMSWPPPEQLEAINLARPLLCRNILAALRGHFCYSIGLELK